MYPNDVDKYDKLLFIIPVIIVILWIMAEVV